MAHYHGLTLADWQAQPRSERAMQLAFFNLEHADPKALATEQTASKWEAAREKARALDALTGGRHADSTD